METFESSLTIDHLWRVADALETRPRDWFSSPARDAQERSDFDHTLPLESVQRHWSELCARVGDPLVGARAGLMGVAHQRSPISFLCAAAPDMRASTRALSRFIGLASPWLPWRVRETPTHVRLEAPLSPSSPGARLLLEYTLGDMIATAEHVVDGWSLSYIELPYAPHDVRALERCWACPVHISPQSHVAFAFPRALIGRAMRLADLDTYTTLERGLEAAWVARGPQPQVHHRVAWMLERARGRLELETAARAVYMSPSTFKRRLRAEGWTFQGLRAEWRVRRVQALLATGELPLDAISDAVGVSEYRALARLMKRHTGRTPGQARDEGVVETLWDARWIAPSATPDPVLAARVHEP